jgi:hypothetical protein
MRLVAGWESPGATRPKRHRPEASVVGAALGQTTDAVLSGTVVGPSGAAIEGATVTVLNVKTGVVSTTTSNSAEVHLFGALQPGAYRITAEHSGFTKLVHNDVVLNLGDRISMNLPLELGTLSNSIEVTAEPETSRGGARDHLIRGRRVRAGFRTDPAELARRQQ